MPFDFTPFDSWSTKTNNQYIISYPSYLHIDITKKLPPHKFNNAAFDYLFRLVQEQASIT